MSAVKAKVDCQCYFLSERSCLLSLQEIYKKQQRLTKQTQYSSVSSTKEQKGVFLSFGLNHMSCHLLAIRNNSGFIQVSKVFKLSLIQLQHHCAEHRYKPTEVHLASNQKCNEYIKKEILYVHKCKFNYTAVCMYAQFSAKVLSHPFIFCFKGAKLQSFLCVLSYLNSDL